VTRSWKNEHELRRRPRGQRSEITQVCVMEMSGLYEPRLEIDK